MTDDEQAAGGSSPSGDGSRSADSLPPPGGGAAPPVTDGGAATPVTDGGAATPAFVAVGGAMVDRYYRLTNLPEPDGGSFARESWRSFGGSAANVACAVARLGRSAGQVTRLGTDAQGDGYADADAIEADLREHGVDVARVRRGEAVGTYSLVLAGPAGQRMVVTGGDSVRNLRLADADWPYLRGAEVVFTNAYAPDPVVSALVEARAAGDLSGLAFDLSGPLAELGNRGTAPATVDDAMATADLVVASDVARRSYCEHHGAGDGVEAAVELLRELGVERAALTHGEAGATLLTPDERVAVDAFDVDDVDATGAGDAFVGGLVDAWLFRGEGAADAGRFAAATAALNCTAEGARANLPTREAVLELVEG